MKVKTKVSHVGLFATPWTIARQTPLSLEFSRQEDEWVAILFSGSPGSAMHFYGNFLLIAIIILNMMALY